MYDRRTFIQEIGKSMIEEVKKPAEDWGRSRDWPQQAAGTPGEAMVQEAEDRGSAPGSVCWARAETEAEKYLGCTVLPTSLCPVMG